MREYISMKLESDILKTLSDDKRLRVLNLLLKSKDALCVCEIADALGLPQYTISKHLSVLKNAGVVYVEKKGLWGYYSLNIHESENRTLFEFLNKFLSRGQFASDRQSLDKRLRLREEGRCVVGFVTENAIVRRIKKKSTLRSYSS